MLYTPGSGSRCTITVPFADDRAGKIPAFVECPQNSSLSLVVKKGLGEWGFFSGNVFDAKTILQRLAPRIQANASLTLKE